MTQSDYVTIMEAARRCGVCLWWLLRTSVRKRDDFALDFCIFSELWHSQMTECKVCWLHGW